MQFWFHTDGSMQADVQSQVWAKFGSGSRGLCNRGVPHLNPSNTSVSVTFVKR